MALRWLHFIFGLFGLGFCTSLTLCLRLDEGAGARRTRKVYPVLMSRAMAWFRWSALVTVLMGTRYFFSMLITDARNSGIWIGAALVWLVGAGLGGGVRGNLFLSASGQGNSRFGLGTRSWDRRAGDRGFLDGYRAEWWPSTYRTGIWPSAWVADWGW